MSLHARRPNSLAVLLTVALSLLATTVPSTAAAQPDLTITSSPDPANPLGLGHFATLEWNATGGDGPLSVRFEVSRTGATGPWEIIASDLPAMGAHSWTVRGPATTELYLRLVVVETTNAETEFLAPGPLTMESPLRLAIPNGGEYFAIDRNSTVWWASSELIPTIDLAVSRNGPGGPFETIATGLSNTGEYAWTVPGPETDNAVVRISGTDSRGDPWSDVSDAVFSIGPLLPVGSISIAFPRAGDSLDIDQTLGVILLETGQVAYAELEFSPVGPDGPWELIQSGVQGLSFVLWTIPGPPTDQAVLRIVGNDANGLPFSDVTDAFVIREDPDPPVIVLDLQSEAEGIRVLWTVIGGPFEPDVWIERATSASGPWARLPELTFSGEVDRYVESDRTYYYRVVIETDTGVIHFSESESVVAQPSIAGLAIGRVGPNPNSGRARLEYAIPSTMHVRIRVVDVTGRQIEVLTDRTHAAGRFAVDVGARNPLEAGIYFVQIQAGSQTVTRRMISAP